MSFPAMAWAWEQRQMLAADKLVLMCLASHAGHRSQACYPKVDSIAEECGLSAPTVRRSIGWLEERGLLRAFAVVGTRGNRANVYVLNVDALAPREFEAYAFNIARAQGRGRIVPRREAREEQQRQRERREVARQGRLPLGERRRNHAGPTRELRRDPAELSGAGEPLAEQPGP